MLTLLMAALSSFHKLVSDGIILLLGGRFGFVVDRLVFVLSFLLGVLSPLSIIDSTGSCTPSVMSLAIGFTSTCPRDEMQ